MPLLSNKTGNVKYLSRVFDYSFSFSGCVIKILTLKRRNLVKVVFFYTNKLIFKFICFYPNDLAVNEVAVFLHQPMKTSHGL